MSRLRVLSLRDNKMTSLSESTFSSIKPTISRLDVEGNIFLCLFVFNNVYYINEYTNVVSVLFYYNVKKCLNYMLIL